MAETTTITPVQAPETVDPETKRSPGRRTGRTERSRPDEVDGGDHDRFAHYCRKSDITRALVTGEAIVALCGKKWVPTRDPSRYPVCPTCRERKAAGWKL